MREILFRGKRDKRYGEGWVFGVPYTDHENDCIMATYYSKLVVIPETVGQFTGLTDKNGKKIFEGDILKHYTQGDIVVNYGVVNWDDDNARWALQLNTMNPSFAMYKPEAFEVIGNIHDNPELLTEQEG